MTKDEFIENYGNVRVSFHSYYKHLFTFTGITEDGYEVVIQVGGNSDDIYRMEVSPDYLETVAGLDPISGLVYDEIGDEIESFHYH